MWAQSIQAVGFFFVVVLICFFFYDFSGFWSKCGKRIKNSITKSCFSAQVLVGLGTILKRMKWIPSAGNCTLGSRRAKLLLYLPIWHTASLVCRRLTLCQTRWSDWRFLFLGVINLFIKSAVRKPLTFPSTSPCMEALRAGLDEAVSNTVRGRCPCL